MGIITVVVPILTDGCISSPSVHSFQPCISVYLCKVLNAPTPNKSHIIRTYYIRHTCMPVLNPIYIHGVECISHVRLTIINLYNSKILPTFVP